MALMEDEQLVLQWLSQYGPMTKGMIGKLFPKKSSATVGRLLMGLKRRNYITQIKDSECFALDRYCEVNRRMHEALWVLFQFVAHIEPSAHYAADAPAQIFFLKDQTSYEIVVLYEQEDHLVKLLHPQNDTKYIFVIPNLEFADQLALPDAPCLFATIEPSDREIPNIIFYSD